MPAVLMEVGVIIDQVDKKYVSGKDNQKAIVQAVVAAVREYGHLRFEKR